MTITETSRVENAMWFVFGAILGFALGWLVVSVQAYFYELNKSKQSMPHQWPADAELFMNVAYKSPPQSWYEEDAYHE